MNMTQSLAMVEAKVEKVLAQLEGLKCENTVLAAENGELRRELARVRKGLDGVRLRQADQAAALKTKLVAVMERIRELESLGL